LGELLTWVAVGGGLAGLVVLAWLLGLASKWNDRRLADKRKAKLYDEKSAELSSLEGFRGELTAYRQRLERWEKDLARVVEEKSQGFPWLAQAFADYFHLENMRAADQLRYKKHPARKAADRVREIAGQRREVEREMRVTRYLIAYYESLFPWLAEFRGEDIDELIQTVNTSERTGQSTEEQDPARRWLAPGEFEKLSTAEKFQRALDRYRSRKKTRWEIGKDYERFVGYLYETGEGTVEYQGIVKGFEDLGRDLVVYKDDYIEVVQCKNWAQSKTIHEKHIFQLYGTMVALQVDKPGKSVQGRFVTTTSLSETAKKYADVLGIKYAENFSHREYPCIKCNISRKNGDRIYHLPFDQQYDTTVIEPKRGECYVATVAEAESLGFRRAFRWKGPVATGA
jgi:hypothetical protein